MIGLHASNPLSVAPRVRFSRKNRKPMIDKRPTPCTITWFRNEQSGFQKDNKRFLRRPEVRGLERSATIPKKRTPSAVELRLGHFLGGSLRLGTQVTQVLMGLDEFISAILNHSFDFALQGIPGSLEALVSPDLICCIAIAITAGTSGIEAELLRKSVQEVFLEVAGPDAELTPSEFRARVVQFLHRRGPAGFIRRFLSLHLFNTVWFQTGDSFRSVAWSTKAFVSDMERVERACQHVVQSTWRSLKISGGLNASAAGLLVERLSSRLSRA
jgi:hypothetical protein